MRLRKRGNKYSIVWDEGDKQVYKPTGCTNREDAELVLAKERKNLERRRQGLPPINVKSDMTFLAAVDGFAHTKRRLSRDRHKTIRRRLLAIGYEVLTGKRLGSHIRKKVMTETVEPFLATRLLLEIRPENLEPWIDDQFEHGNGKYGHKGSTYKTVKEKVRQIEELFDFWHRRKKAIGENPIVQLDMPKTTEVPENAQPRKVRRPFEVDEAVEFFRALEDLDAQRAARYAQDKREVRIDLVPAAPIFRALLATGCRSMELLQARVHEVVLDSKPHVWVPMSRCKTRYLGERAATIHPDLALELTDYKKRYRKDADPEDVFFLSPEGKTMDSERLNDLFYEALYLAFVRMEVGALGASHPKATEHLVARFLRTGKINFGGGSRLRVETLALRGEAERAIKEIASRIRLKVEKRAEELDPYCLRHTHGTWAADQEVPEIHISKQLGHSIRGITGRYISKRSMTLIDPRRCSHAVWELLAKAELEREDRVATSGSSAAGA